MHSCILLFGRDLTLLHTRLLLLEGAGHCAFATHRLGEVDAIVEASPAPITIVLLCHTVSLDDQAAVLGKLRIQLPHVLSVALLPYIPSQAISGGCADVDLSVPGPEAFLDWINGLFGVEFKSNISDELYVEEAVVEDEVLQLPD